MVNKTFIDWYLLNEKNKWKNYRKRFQLFECENGSSERDSAWNEKKMGVLRKVA